MGGLYVHIPYCRQACVYCNFHFKTGLKGADEMVKAIVAEIALRHTALGESVETIYFGGGTPSFLPPALLSEIFKALHQYFDLSGVKECTLEANPDDITHDNLKQWKALGVNRFSIGVQSFIEGELRWMNRAHSAEQSKVCIEMALAEGFEVSADLIFGLPGSTNEGWLNNLKTMNSLGVHHLSCYGLTLESGTAWEKLIQRNSYKGPDETAGSEQFMLTMDFLRNNGWEQYEISNYCRPGYEAKHNTAYWQNKPYLGFGPSAHSYNGSERQWNIGDNARYTEALLKGQTVYEKEILTPENKINEYLMTALRTKWGIQPSVISNAGFDADSIISELEKLSEEGKTEKFEDRYRLTALGKCYADAIAASLFV